MSARLPIEALRERAYLKVGDCARLFGRSSQWWADAYDAHRLDGYQDGPRGDRYVTRESAERLIASVGRQRRAATPQEFKARCRRRMEGFRGRFLQYLAEREHETR
jgi:hypothetical protein